jgi:glycosyltransferase involved in cell wall biosynthesis
MEPANVVVVVPAHNERPHLPRCLRAITTTLAGSITKN